MRAAGRRGGRWFSWGGSRASVPLTEPFCTCCQVYVRAMIDYWPQEDPDIPCMDAGLPFLKGDILQIVDQNDALWWQARKISDLAVCAGLIPSDHLLKRWVTWRQN